MRSATSGSFSRLTLRLPIVLAACGFSPLAAQDPAQAAPGPERPAGIPVTSNLVIQRCGTCHVRDSTGRMGRISYLRKTPEGWEISIRRMVSLNGVQLEPNVAREIVRYLAGRHGLAPEELRPGHFEAERRMVDYTYPGDRDTENTCKACHSMGRVITQRRTKDEWGLLVAMHRGYYPDADFQAFRRGGPPPDSGDRRHPMEKAIDHLGRVFPLETPEWTAWSATMRPPRLEGAWALSGNEPGRGPLYGRFTVTPNPQAPDEFTTEATYVYAKDGARVTRRGRAIVYTGYQWRGRSIVGSDSAAALREVMVVERNWREMSGRWFTGGYDELGMDVTLRRVAGDPVVSGVFPRALRAGTTGQELRIYGANLPGTLKASAIDFGPGVRVSSVSAAGPDMVSVRLDAAADAVIGKRDLFVAGAGTRDAIVIYDKVNRLRLTPAAGMARVGGVNFPKQLQPFEAAAASDGPDGKPNTDDDLDLGPVDVTWGLEEYAVTYDDDDLQFVGQIDPHGVFTPAVDGPNLNRSGNRDNVGDVWVVATYDPHDGRPPIRGRAHLVVTVPLYVRWDPWRVAQ